MEFTTLDVSLDAGVATIALNRPDKANAMSEPMWYEIEQAMEWLDTTPEARVGIITGRGKFFTAGIDLSLLMGLGAKIQDDCDGRRHEKLRRLILRLQDTLTSIERCRKPVLAAVHGACIGGGIDLVTACDMRYCSSNAYFTVKEIDVGMTADVGTLQRLPRLIGEGMARELAYTGRKVDGIEAQKIHLVNRCFETPESLEAGVMEIARTIAAKSPLAVRGCKEMITYGRDHSVADGLNYIATWNAAMLLSKDLFEAGAAAMQKRDPVFRGLMEHFFAPVNGIRLHCVSAGAADAPLMLFVHGFPEFWQCWKGQLEEFGRDHRAVAFDLRGHNLSDKPEGVAAYRHKPLLEDLRQLIEYLQAGREDKSCILVAHDWGGAIAWTFAAAHPQYVKKLVIINAPHTVPFARALAADPAQQAASRYMLLLRQANAERVLEADGYARLLQMFSRTRDGRCALTDDEIPLYRAAWSQPGALTGALNLYRASPLYPPTPEDPGAAALRLDPAAFMVRVPTLVIWGEADSALGTVLLDGLDELVPDLRIRRIPEGSHWVVHERPRQVSAAIREFLAEA